MEDDLKIVGIHKGEELLRTEGRVVFNAGSHDSCRFVVPEEEEEFYVYESTLSKCLL